MPSALQRKALSLATASRPGTNHSPHKPVISPKTPRPPPCPSFKTVKVFNSPRNHHPPPSCTQSQQPCPSLRRRLYDLDRRFVSSAPRSCIAVLANASSSQQPAACADARVGPSTDHRFSHFHRGPVSQLHRSFVSHFMHPVSASSRSCIALHRSFVSHFMQHGMIPQHSVLPPSRSCIALHHGPLSQRHDSVPPLTTVSRLAASGCALR